MLNLGGRRAPLPATPVPATSVGVQPCVACTADRTTRIPVLLGDGSCGVVCSDAHGCAVRYRGGVSPESYAAELRGDILTAASL